MNVDFNTNPVGKPDPATPAPQPAAPRPVAVGDTFQNIDALEQKLKDLPALRHERVERAKGLATNVQFPPDEVLVGIANLLAMNIK